MVKGDDAFYGISVDTLATDTTITWSFDTSDYNVISGALNSPAVEVEYTKKGDYVASVNVVSALADTDVTKTINTSVTVPRFDVSISGPSTIDKGDPATFKMSTIATDGVYSWNITPSNFTLVSGSLSSDTIEVTFDKKGSFDVEGSVQSDYQQDTKTQVKTVTSDTPRLQLVVDAPKSAKKGDIIKLKATASAVRAFTPDYVYQWTVSRQHTVISGDLNSPELEIQLDTNGQYQHTCLVKSAYLEQQKIVSKNTDVTLRALTADITGTTNTEKKDNGTYKCETNAPDAQRLWSITPFTYVIISGTNTTEDIEIDFLKAGAYDISCEVASSYLEDTKTDNVKTSVFVPNHSVGLSGSSSAKKLETKTYTATSNAPDAVYNWTSPGNTITGSGSSVDITFPNKGSNTVDVEIVSDYLEDTSTRGKGVNVTIPKMNLSLSGPSSSVKGQTQKYVINTNAPDASVNWAVSVPSDNVLTIAPDKMSADITWNKSGNQYLQIAVVSAYHEETLTDSKNTTVTVPVMTASLSGATRVTKGDTETYTLTHNAPDADITWTRGHPTDNIMSVAPDKMSADVTWNKSGSREKVNVEVKSTFLEDTKLLSESVNVSIPKLTARIIGDAYPGGGGEYIYTLDTNATDGTFEWSGADVGNPDLFDNIISSGSKTSQTIGLTFTVPGIYGFSCRVTSDYHEDNMSGYYSADSRPKP